MVTIASYDIAVFWLPWYTDRCVTRYPLNGPQHHASDFGCFFLWKFHQGQLAPPLLYPVLAHRIHGTGIFAYFWSIFMVNVGKYTRPMDPMGSVHVQNTPPKKQQRLLTRRAFKKRMEMLEFADGSGSCFCPLAIWNPVHRSRLVQ